MFIDSVFIDSVSIPTFNFRTPIGNINLLQNENSPAEAAVKHDMEYYYGDMQIKQTPQAMLLPMITLAGDENTKNGGWEIIKESDYSQVFAFLLVLSQKILKGPAELAGKMKKAAAEVEVLLLKIDSKDGLFLEWGSKQSTSHKDQQHSAERTTVRCKFFVKVDLVFRNEAKKNNQEFSKKDFAKAFVDAEAAGKFITAKGNGKVKSEEDVTRVMNIGEYLCNNHMIDLWEVNELWPEGKTPLFCFSFGSWFPGACNDCPRTGLWVLTQIDNIRLGKVTGKSKLTKKKILDANIVRMKDIVKTLILEYNWMAEIQGNVSTKPIMSAERMAKDMAELKKVCGDQSGFIDLVKDAGGIQATLNPLTQEVLGMFIRVAHQEEFTRFATAEALHKSFPKTCESDTLVELCKPVVDKWTDAHNQFTGAKDKHDKEKNDKDPEGEEDDEEKDARPTRSVAIGAYAEQEVKTYCPHYVKIGDAQLDRKNIKAFAICQPCDEDSAPRNLETNGNRRPFFTDQGGMKNPNSAYVKGRNEYRTKIGMDRDVLEEDVSLWTSMSNPGVGSREKNVDVLVMYNGDQLSASREIKAHLKDMKGVQLKKIILRGKQEDLERRLKLTGNAKDTLGDLDGVPGMSEECFQIFGGPPPTRRAHRYTNAGIVDNVYPEEVIALPDPARMEPQVTHALRKRIFPPSSDGNAKNIARDEPAPTEKADKEDKDTEKLCTYGRDQKYVENALWLLGASQVIVHGVGNGMVAWVCLLWRIPCLCIFDNDEHAKCVLDYITKKVEDLMKKAVPANTRWWKDNEQLRCIPDVVKEKKEKKRKAAASEKSKSSSSSKSSSGSSSSSKKPKKQ